MNADAAADALKLAEQRHDAADDVGALRFAQKALQLDETLAGAHALMHRLKKFGPGSEMKAIVDRILQARVPRWRRWMRGRCSSHSMSETTGARQWQQCDSALCLRSTPRPHVQAGNHYSVFDTTYASFDANAEATAYRQLSKRVHPGGHRRSCYTTTPAARPSDAAPSSAFAPRVVVHWRRATAFSPAGMPAARPDKNHARGAEDAFKKLSEAHTVSNHARTIPVARIRARPHRTTHLHKIQRV